MRMTSLYLLTALWPLAATADPLLEKAANISTEGALYAYEMALRREGVTITGMVDPSAPQGARIMVYSPDEADWPKGFADELVKIDKATNGDIWCKEYADLVPPDARKTGETAETVTYSFNPVPDKDADGTERKLMKKLEADITLAKEDGAVLSYSAILPKPYKPAMVVKIETFRMAAECKRSPDGRTYSQQFDFEIDGSAMMQDFSQQTSRTITKLLEPVG